MLSGGVNSLANEVGLEGLVRKKRGYHPIVKDRK